MKTFEMKNLKVKYRNGLLVALPLFAFVLLCQSCLFKDDTTLGTKEISEVTIGQERLVYNISVGERAEIDPLVTQSIEGVELSYEWSVLTGVENAQKLEFLTDEPVFNEQFKGLGSFQIRLKVTNEYGGNIQFFTVNVVTPYEEGLIVVSNDQTGNSDLSFLKTLTPEEIAEGLTPKFETGVFSKIHPEVPLREVVAMEQINNRLVILSKDQGRIFLLDDKTMDIISEVAYAEQFAGFVPKTFLARIYVRPGGISYFYSDNYVLSEDGRVYGYNVLFNEMFESSKFPAEVRYDKAYLHTFDYNTTWRKYFIQHDEGMVFMPGDAGFAGARMSDFYSDYYILNMVSAETSGTNMDAFIICKSKIPGEENKVIIHNGIRTLSFNKASYEYETTEELTVSEDTEMAYNLHSDRVYYFKDNKLYEWFPNVFKEEKLPSPEDAILTLDGEEITSMSFTRDWKKIYLGVNDNSRSENSGSVIEFDPLTHEIITRHNHIANKPVKVFYKIK